jgi:hypothetical protein
MSCFLSNTAILQWGNRYRRRAVREPAINATTLRKGEDIAGHLWGFVGSELSARQVEEGKICV